MPTLYYVKNYSLKFNMTISYRIPVSIFMLSIVLILNLFCNNYAK